MPGGIIGNMRMKIKEASEILGLSQQALRIGLQRNKFDFGVAIKMSNRYTYYINREKFNNYIKGKK